MCILFENDEITTATQADRVVAAYARVTAAQRDFVSLALRLDEGAKAEDFPGINADHYIRRIIGEMVTSRYEADQAVASLFAGSPFRLDPTLRALQYEAQARLIRNGRSSSARLPAVGSFAAE